MEQYLEGKEPDVDTLKIVLEKEQLKGSFVPTLWISI